MFLGLLLTATLNGASSTERISSSVPLNISENITFSPSVLMGQNVPCSFDATREGVAKKLFEKISGLTAETPPPNLPVTVNTSLLLINFFGLDEYEGTMFINAYFIRFWQDSRLSLGCLHKPLWLNQGERKNVWRPSVSLLNYGVTDTKAPSTPEAFVVAPGGVVISADRLHFKVPCNINYHSFPFDAMKCELIVSTSTEPHSDVIVDWTEDNPVSVTGNRSTLPTHFFDKVTFEDVRSPELAGDHFIFRVATIHFKRYRTYYILQAYIPNVITELVAWVGFSIPADAVPARVTLGVSSLITMALQYGNQGRSLPKIGYITSMDVWMIICTLFIFSTLLEYGVICEISRRSDCTNKRKKTETMRTLNKIDHTARYIFLLLFIIFVYSYHLYGKSIALNLL